MVILLTFIVMLQVHSIPASGLANGRRSLIGLLVPSGIWPFIPDLMRGVAEAIEQTPYELVLCSVNKEDLKKGNSDVVNRVFATQLTGDNRPSATSSSRTRGDVDNGKNHISDKPFRIQLATQLIVRGSCGSGDQISIVTTQDQKLH